MCAAANSDAGPGSELLSAIHTTHTRHNAPAVVCDISASRLQGSYRDTPEYDKGYIGDVDKASGWRDEWDKASSGSEAADISEVILIVDLEYLCGQACWNVACDGLARNTERHFASRASIGYHDDGDDNSQRRRS